MELFFRIIRRFLLMIEWVLSFIWSAISKLLPFWKLKPVVEIFNAVSLPHQSKSAIWIYGRVLSERKLIPPTLEDSSWINFKRMAGQWFTREIPKTGITVTIGEISYQTISDKEGYFEILTTNTSDSCKISLDSYPYESSFYCSSSNQNPEYVIITDVDDTLLETGATSLGKMIQTTLLGNSLTRELVPGISELINELHHTSNNPVFYVTSSPWNLHGFLGRVFTRAQLPKGGIFMTDWGLTPKQWLTPRHDVHKGSAIKRIAEWYQQSEFILFGDNSQVDHKIYADFIRANPEKIKAVFIRNVSSAEKADDTLQIINRVNKDINREIMFFVDNAEEIKHQLNQLLST